MAANNNAQESGKWNKKCTYGADLISFFAKQIKNNPDYIARFNNSFPLDSLGFQNVKHRR